VPRGPSGSGSNKKSAKLATEIPSQGYLRLAIGYLLLALVALYFKNLTVVEISAYLLPCLMSFLAVDIRDGTGFKAVEEKAGK
jgi:hypothetical protein